MGTPFVTRLVRVGYGEVYRFEFIKKVLCFGELVTLC